MFLNNSTNALNLIAGETAALHMYQVADLVEVFSELQPFLAGAIEPVFVILVLPEKTYTIIAFAAVSKYWRSL